MRSTVRSFFIFALGTHGLGKHAKKASVFIVMAILGGAIMPKLMGHLGDVHGMSMSFLMPLGCFAIICGHGFLWPALSRDLDRLALGTLPATHQVERGG